MANKNYTIPYTKLKKMLEDARKKFIEDENIDIYRVAGYIDIFKDVLTEDLKEIEDGMF